MLAAALALLAPPALPNIVYILADDIGYGDLSSYGAKKVQTPNIDRIGREGIRFTDAHSPAAVCTPTRYSLMTGEYAWRSKRGGEGILSGVAPLCIDLAKNKTLPQMLKQAGYTTGISGKWHLGLGETKSDYNGLISPGPKEVGFDYSFIIPATGDRVPCVYVENGRVVNYDPNDPIQVQYGKKIGDDPTGKENPELLKLKTVPGQGHLDTIVNGISRIGFMSGGKKARWVDEDMADTITGKAVDFIKKNASKPFFLYFPTHDIHAPQRPNARFEGKSNLGLRGDTITELDWSVGQVLKTLDDLKLSKNTIVIFTSDNGGTPNDGYADPRENNEGHNVNGALRGEKYTDYEGGHRVPFVIRWPGKIPSGRVSTALISQMDMYSSFASLVSVPVGPRDAVDSFDLSDVLLGRKLNGGRDTLAYLRGGKVPLGLRKGDWSLVPKPAGAELFNLRTDPGQKKNVAAENPEVVRAMQEEVARIQAGVRTRP